MKLMDKLNTKKKRDLANCKKGEGKDATTLHEYESKQIAKLRTKNIEKLASMNLVYSDKGYGLLDMQIEYKHHFVEMKDTANLKVHLQQTKGLRRVDIMSLSDPYAKVYLLKKSSDETDGYLKYSKNTDTSKAEKKNKEEGVKILISKYRSRTRYFENQLSPNFDTEFTFCGIPTKDVFNYDVVVSIWDRNEIFNNKFLCGARIPLNTFYPKDDYHNGNDKTYSMYGTYFFTVRLQKSYADGHPLTLKPENFIAPEKAVDAENKKFESVKKLPIRAQVRTSSVGTQDSFKSKSLSTPNRNESETEANRSSRSNMRRIFTEDVDNQYKEKYTNQGYTQEQYYQDGLIVAHKKPEPEITSIIQGGFETHSRGYSPIHYYEEVTENDGTRKEQVPLTVTETQGGYKTYSRGYLADYGETEYDGGRTEQIPLAVTKTQAYSVESSFTSKNSSDEVEKFHGNRSPSYLKGVEKKKKRKSKDKNKKNNHTNDPTYTSSQEEAWNDNYIRNSNNINYAYENQEVHVNMTGDKERYDVIQHGKESMI